MQIEVPDQLKEFRNTRYGCIVSFDFDDTLTLPAYNPVTKCWEHTLEPNYPILTELVRLATQGYAPIVISERDPTDYNKARIRQFLLLYDLPVKSIIYTGGEDKSSFAAAAASQIHYDDDPYEIFQLAEYDIAAVAVPHPSDYMTDEDYQMAEDSWRAGQVFG